jgi:hypothetical protein
MSRPNMLTPITTATGKTPASQATKSVQHSAKQHDRSFLDKPSRTDSSGLQHGLNNKGCATKAH